MLRTSTLIQKKGLKNLAVDRGLDAIGEKNKKGFSSITVSGITLRNKEIKDILKVIRSLENRRILMKRTTKKITSQEGRFLNFPKPLMSAVNYDQQQQPQQQMQPFKIKFLGPVRQH